ncbi:MAG: peptidylprolyl isomerase [Polyangiaceae bacterium]|nr:peptidylprolyl isomerase [Polyangiaceae bacterium]
MNFGRGSLSVIVIAALTALALSACKKVSRGAPNLGPHPEDASADSGASPLLDVIARAENARRARDIGPERTTSHDVTIRRRSAQALSRIADAESLEGLAALLGDEDMETVTWAAYGLGYACKGHEDAHVKMLAARAATLGSGSALRKPLAASSQRGISELDPRIGIARAIGKCNAVALSESILVSWLKADGWDEAAALGLGDLATRRHRLGEDAMTALLDAASASREKPLDMAFYALSRVDAGDPFAQRVVETARSALGRPSDARILAIKTLGRAGVADAAADLANVVTDAAFAPAERAEAVRALGSLGAAGQSAAADTLARLMPDKDPVAIQSLSGFNVLYTLIDALGSDPPKKVDPALGVLARIAVPADRSPALELRFAELRCKAALALSRGASDTDLLRKCDDESSEVSERTRLAALVRNPLTRERKSAFVALSKSTHLRVREAAVEAIADHLELGETGAAILANALGSNKAGLVAMAAEVLDTHPDRAFVLAESEKRAALDPRALPPTANPKEELSPLVDKALAAALAAHWPEDRFETRIGLIEAAASVRHASAKDAAIRACTGPNAIVREAAQKALRSLGESVAPCHALPREPSEIGATLTRPLRIVLTTSNGELGVTLEPALSPVTAAHIAALARAGFYKGIVVHRVVPGFVVQFGDPDGDGYGGSGTPVRCETAPVAFAPLDVGLALTGRDTGSSQLFVTLSRTPQLDGEYTRVGKADGNWASVVEGDIIVDTRVEE